MKIESIELNNWGPYRGKHVINLAVTDTSPVVLIHGENMRGKTSLLRAIVWCLYGRLRNQDNRSELDVSRLVNIPELIQFGEVDFGVVLNLVHRGEDLELRRSGKAALSIGDRAHVQRVAVSLLPRGGQPFAEEHIAEKISSILNPQVSDFFFFDGEMLSRFEERLRDDKPGSQGFVKSQVERALGLPFLKTLEDDLDQIRRDIDSDIQKSLRADKKATALIDQYKQAVELERSAIANDLELKDREARLEEQLNAIDQQLAEVESIKDHYYERKSLEAEVQTDVLELGRLEDEIRGRHEQYWWFPLAERLEEERSSLLDKMDRASRSEREAANIRADIKNAEHRLHDRVCPTCRQDLANFDASLILAECSALEKKLAELPKLPDVGELQRRGHQLNKYAAGPSVVASVMQASKDLRRLRLKMDGRKSRIREIEDDLQNVTLDIAGLESQRQSLRDALGKSKTYLSASEIKLQKSKAEVKRLSAEIALNPKVPVEDRGRLEFAESALVVVKESFVEFSHQMRMDVEEKASALFTRLTTEKDYSGVAISSDYSIRILNSDKRPVDLISAGGNQVLTMSFIGALAECSAEEAPMVMDTPFGRLDKGHREAILRWVGETSSQTILFVQSGEYSESRDRPLLGDRVGRELRIERLGEQESRVSAI